MTEKEKVEEIMEKYNRNFSTLQKNASAKELKTVFKFVADESNRKQRELIGFFLCNESRYGRKGNHNQQLN